MQIETISLVVGGLAALGSALSTVVAFLQKHRAKGARDRDEITFEVDGEKVVLTSESTPEEIEAARAKLSRTIDSFREKLGQ